MNCNADNCTPRILRVVQVCGYKPVNERVRTPTLPVYTQTRPPEHYAIIPHHEVIIERDISIVDKMHPTREGGNNQVMRPPQAGVVLGKNDRCQANESNHHTNSCGNSSPHQLLQDHACQQCQHRVF